jgi:hypothetical protein
LVAERRSGRLPSIVQQVRENTSVRRQDGHTITNDLVRHAAVDAADQDLVPELLVAR